MFFYTKKQKRTKINKYMFTNVCLCVIFFLRRKDNEQKQTKINSYLLEK